MDIARKRIGKSYAVNNRKTSVAEYRNDKLAVITIRDKNERCFLGNPRGDSLLGNCVVTRLYNNRGAVFSVLRGACHDYIKESNSEGSGCRSTEE
jgi:hypothetical protein